MAQTENDILDHVYADYEGDDDGWEATDDEYLAGRKYANQGISMWENYDNTKWRELFAKHSNTASTVTKTITAGTYTYTCSTDFREPVSYVRTVRSGVSTYYTVFPVETIPVFDDESSLWVYFTGSPKDGYTLNFNPELTLSTGDTIQYEYYKSATTFTATTSTTEMRNPFFLVHYILWRMYKNDGEDGKAREEFQVAQQILEQMRTDNMQGLWNQSFNISENADLGDGFGV
jgi:plastocyanin